ncbi:acyl-CoA carboxylase subunit beta [Haloarcula sp. JP-Z28]|uniref:Acetyl-CoA carboxylase alpha subunit n=1 Tax=Haloarcula marismortui (strain ATCC 43049 / DSM 3752 / JCM 8966 / VKM B-1809) TaxID=272569 RepID=Q5V3M3_HALMA|nr:MULTISPECIES: acyl-CoA carboxylase subunit beta [Haloarcula]AAV45879.1 acetyl-CoA carboxylase alpha subunit [Haloarcula marismortui ATCC 43049]NHN62044.1 acyl-CoA carboxylase subunit beta [Haloarcula sp. JP-Z28]QCP90651.1 acyl-CoA carboxylase subunit beta [Haloarcula marismortui ATCC 43049]
MSQQEEPDDETGAPDDAVEELRQKRAEAELGGGEARIESQHEKGKMTARERIDFLVDDGTFNEVDPFVEHRSTNFGMEEKRFAGDAVVTGYGEVDGRKVFLFAHDFTVLGGSVGEVVADKICKVMDRAIENGVPVIGLNDSGGARIQEGVDSLVGFAKIFERNTKASGLIPQISAIMGPCAGGATYSPALTDFTFMVQDTSHMFITGPDVIETVTGEQVSKEELGGAGSHSTKSGVAHFSYPSEEEALENIRRLLSYLPANNMEDPPRVKPWDDPDREIPGVTDIVPSAPRKPYDMTKVIDAIVDEDSFFEVHGNWARNVVVGFSRMDGQSVGVVANQPRVSAGTLDIDAAEKAARFVRFCDSFNIPILTLVDVPGFMPGTDQEHNGIIRRGAKLIYAYAEATVPLLSVVVRKAYGGAYIVMSSKFLGSDVNYAWPGSEMAVLGPRGAVNILYRNEIADAGDPDAKRQELMDEFRDEFANPYGPAKRGYLDDVIEPKETRKRLIQDLDLLQRKREDTPPKDHGNIPL